jgi:hypothetical protein
MQTKKIAFILAVLVLIPSITFAAAKHTNNTHSAHLQKISNQYLIAPSSPSLNTTGDLTLEAWVKFASLPEDNKTYTILAKWGALTPPGSDSNDSFALWFQKNSGIYQIQLGTDNGASHTGSFVDWSPSVNTWYHIAVVYSTAGTSTVYIDGSVQGTMNGLTTSIQATNSPLLIGQYAEAMANNFSDIGFFDGSIDEVRIYNLGRTQSEIQSDYLHEVTGKETGLVGYWQLDKSFMDLTKNHNNLTPMNGASLSSETPFKK